MGNKEIEDAAKDEIKISEAKVEKKKSLGKITPKHEIQKSEGKKLAAEFGYKNIPINTLPSKGLFYQSGTEIAIRAASAREIRHWSTIDDTDELNVDDLLNFIMDACIKIKIPEKRGHYKDLKEIDRFYLIFAIREYTFKEGENKLFAELPDPGNNDKKEKVEITKDIIKYFEPSEKLMKFYNEETKTFLFNTDKPEQFEISIPSLGITSFLKDYAILKNQKRESIDRDFLKYAPFKIIEWRGLTDKVYETVELMKSYDWNLKEISVMSDVFELIRDSINPVMNVTLPSGREVTAPLTFLGGLKAIFTIPDILDQLD